MLVFFSFPRFLYINLFRFIIFEKLQKLKHPFPKAYGLIPILQAGYIFGKNGVYKMTQHKKNTEGSKNLEWAPKFIRIPWIFYKSVIITFLVSFGIIIYARFFIPEYSVILPVILGVPILSWQNIFQKRKEEFDEIQISITFLERMDFYIKGDIKRFEKDKEFFEKILDNENKLNNSQKYDSKFILHNKYVKETIYKVYPSQKMKFISRVDPKIFLEVDHAFFCFKESGYAIEEHVSLAERYLVNPKSTPLIREIKNNLEYLYLTLAFSKFRIAGVKGIEDDAKGVIGKLYEHGKYYYFGELKEFKGGMFEDINKVMDHTEKHLEKLKTNNKQINT